MSEPEEDPILTLVQALLERAPDRLSPIGAGIMAASHFGIAADSRSMARKMDLAHALVLRECVALAEEQGLIEIDEARQDRSQRLFYGLSASGQSLLAEVL